MAITFVVLYAIPLSGTIRLDLLGGDHRLLGRESGALEVALLYPVVAAALYLLTFLLNWPLGRLFCGFGCPIGHASRLADGAEVEAARKLPRRGPRLRFGAFCLVLAGGLAVWFGDPAALARDPGSGALVALTAVALTAALLIWHARAGRWIFCRKLCPIGIYYTAIQIAHRFGVQFEPERGRCVECRLCEIVCPVALDPRRLDERVAGGGGLAFDGFPGKNYCLECGDCVRACELMVRRKEPAASAPLELRFWSAESAATQRSAQPE